jgi:hypothetical protein
MQGQCKSSAIELAQIAEAPPVLADECQFVCKDTDYF